MFHACIGVVQSAAIADFGLPRVCHANTAAIQVRVRLRACAGDSPSSSSLGVLTLAVHEEARGCQGSLLVKARFWLEILGKRDSAQFTNTAKKQKSLKRSRYGT